MTLEERLAGVRAEMIRDGLVRTRQPNGLPWCYSIAEAAVFVGCSEEEMRRLIDLRVVHTLNIGHQVISATQVFALKNRLAVGWQIRRATRVGRSDQ